MADALRAFQLTLGRYLRDPVGASLPDGIEPRRAKVYEELLFNNLCSYVDSCFPVCKSITGKANWLTLCRHFFRDWRSQSPRFSDIPSEFLNFLQHSRALDGFPPWFFELAHYEWIELHLETWDETSERTRSDQQALIAINHPVVNLAYHWPVHRISADFQPDMQTQTFLVVTRNGNHLIEFLEVSAATSLLIDIAMQQPLSRGELVGRVGQALKVDMDDNLIQLVEQEIKKLIGFGILTSPLNDNFDAM